MKMIRAYGLVCMLLFMLFTMGHAADITPAEKQKLFSLESDILSLLKERHALAGDAIDLRVKILDAKKRVVPENAEEIRTELSMLNAALKEKNVQIEAKNELIQAKTAELRALAPGAATRSVGKSSVKKKKRSSSVHRS